MIKNEIKKYPTFNKSDYDFYKKNGINSLLIKGTGELTVVKGYNVSLILHLPKKKNLK